MYPKGGITYDEIETVAQLADQVLQLRHVFVSEANDAYVANLLYNVTTLADATRAH